MQETPDEKKNERAYTSMDTDDQEKTGTKGSKTSNKNS